jgi:DNA-directed RNA polymerase subunit RPC12/RpoP
VARWVLECSHCKAEFTHSEISEDGYTGLDPFTLTPTKPELAVGGVTIVCPNCNGTAVYKRYKLLYRTV